MNFVFFPSSTDETLDRGDTSRYYVYPKTSPREITTEPPPEEIIVDLACLRASLEEAVDTGNVNYPPTLISASPPVISAKPISAVHEAVGRSDEKQVSSLLLRGELCNEKDGEGDDPIHVAAKLGHEQIWTLLLLKGAEKNALYAKGRTPLHLAAENGHILAVNALLAADADVNIRYAYFHRACSAMDSAAGEEHVDILRAALQHGKNVNSACKDGYTSLHIAAFNN